MRISKNRRMASPSLDGENKELDEPEFQQDANELLFAPGHCFLQQSSIVAYSGGAHLKNNHMK